MLGHFFERFRKAGGFIAVGIALKIGLGERSAAHGVTKGHSD